VCGVGQSEDIIQASLDGILRALSRSAVATQAAA
jgi:hypothetical protein